MTTSTGRAECGGGGGGFFASGLFHDRIGKVEFNDLRCVKNLLHIRWNIKLYLEPLRQIGETCFADGVRNGILFVRKIGSGLR